MKRKHDFETSGDFATCRRCGLRVRAIVAGRSIDLAKVGNPCGPPGLGTRLANFFAWLGFKKCRRCGEREQRLNRWFPW